MVAEPVVLERDLERHFAKECRRLNLATLKLALRFSTGWPDRLVLLKKGRILWVELKTKTGVLSDRQKAVHSLLMIHNHNILVLRTKEEITNALEAASVPAKRSEVLAKQRLFSTVAGSRIRKNKHHLKGNSGIKKGGASKESVDTSTVETSIRSVAGRDPEVG